MSPPLPAAPVRPRRLRVRARLGKYRIESLLAEGYYSHVYQAFDTIAALGAAGELAVRDHAKRLQRCRAVRKQALQALQAGTLREETPPR